MNLFNKIKDSTSPVFVVAEMAWAHDGSVEKAKNIVKAAKDANADAINIHVTYLSGYMVHYYGNRPGVLSNTAVEKSSVYDYLEKINLSFDDVKQIASYAKEIGILLSVMCNDQESLEFVEKEINPDLLMIHPSSLTIDSFAAEVAKRNKPTVLYCGGLTIGEIDKAIRIFEKVGNRQIILQHGFQSYPTHLEDNHLKYLETLKNLFGYPTSFGDHTDGGDPFALIVPLLAIPYGVRIIEKHITFCRDEKGEDFESALDPEDFKTFVQYIKMAEKTIGIAHQRPLSEREIKYRDVVRKRAIAAKDLSPGDVVLQKHIVFMRSNDGLFPEEIESLINKVPLTKKVGKGLPLTWDEFK